MTDDEGVATKSDVSMLKSEFDLLRRDMEIWKRDITIQVWIVGTAIIAVMAASTSSADRAGSAAARPLHLAEPRSKKGQCDEGTEP